jgi:proline dehydrogenase
MIPLSRATSSFRSVRPPTRWLRYAVNNGNGLRIVSGANFPQHERLAPLLGGGDRRYSDDAHAKHSAASSRISFDDPRMSYGVQSTADIVRALLIFKICSNKWLVKNCEAILKGAISVFGENIVMGVVRPSFFAHFCAGEDATSIQPRIDYLNGFGIGGILDYAAEADIEEDDGGGAAEENVDSNTASSIVYSARQYDYSTEKQCNKNAEIFAQAIESVHNVTPNGFAAIKITALCNPALLERWSTSLVEIRNLFQRLDANDNYILTYDEFRNGWQKYFNAEENEIRKRFEQFDQSGSGKVSAIEWTTALRPRNIADLASGCKGMGPFAKSALSDEEIELMENMERRVDELTSLADRLGVRLMIDAEHSYFQPAIDNIVLKLQRKYNVNGNDRIYNTFQCYLKDSSTRIQEHILRSDYEGWEFAAKLVRGAYMVLERERATTMGYDSPIHETLEDTHQNYDGAIRTIITRESVQEKRSKVNLVVASHNQTSVEKTIAAMDEEGISKVNHNVYFGQLLGMADHLTFTLGMNGYSAYKYVPYGPINEVMPYLIRRAQENSDIMSGVTKERKMLWDELIGRLTGTKAKQ